MELEKLGVPLKDMKPPRGDNIRPGPAFWLVLIVIGGATVWQKVSTPPKPVTVIKTGKSLSGAQAISVLGLFEGGDQEWHTISMI